MRALALWPFRVAMVLRPPTSGLSAGPVPQKARRARGLIVFHYLLCPSSAVVVFQLTNGQLQPLGIRPRVETGGHPRGTPAARCRCRQCYELHTRFGWQCPCFFPSGAFSGEYNYLHLPGEDGRRLMFHPTEESQYRSGKPVLRLARLWTFLIQGLSRL